MKLKEIVIATMTDVEEELIDQRPRCGMVAPLASRLWVQIESVQAHWGAVGVGSFVVVVVRAWLRRWERSRGCWCLHVGSLAVCSSGGLGRGCVPSGVGLLVHLLRGLCEGGH